jgi:hypothetical protein
VAARPAGSGTKLADAVIRSGRAVSETAAGFARVSWVDGLGRSDRSLPSQAARSVRYFRDPTSKSWTRFEP